MPRKAMKPNKAIAKRFRVTKTGKLKRHHAFTSHLMSARPANKRRKLRRAAIVSETHARRLRKLMGVFVTPGKVAAVRQRRSAAAAAKAEGAGEAK
jgi:large subunit ribosomal protein L35